MSGMGRRVNKNPTVRRRKNIWKEICTRVGKNKTINRNHVNLHRSLNKQALAFAALMTVILAVFCVLSAAEYNDYCAGVYLKRDTALRWTHAMQNVHRYF